MACDVKLRVVDACIRWPAEGEFVLEGQDGMPCLNGVDGGKDVRCQRHLTTGGIHFGPSG